MDFWIPSIGGGTRTFLAMIDRSIDLSWAPKMFEALFSISLGLTKNYSLHCKNLLFLDFMI